MPDGTRIPPELEAAATKLADDFPYFARRCLRVRTKTGEVVPFHINRSQIELHKRIEAQIRRTGKARLLVVKARQVGISTYIQARYYWRLWRSNRALKAYILTHEDPATQNLFGMAQRFQENMPDGVRPPTSAANAKELVFADSGCGYRVATAGNKAGGRSDTVQLFHGSEVAYWPNGEEHIAGVFQTVGNVPGSEIILESTANGIGNVFSRYSYAAVRGVGEYEVVFIPWFWDDQYQSPCAGDWSPSPKWVQYGLDHKLDWPQLYWAYEKNQTLATAISASADEPCWKFKQEYPATFEEAFQTSGNSFIPGPLVLKARRPTETVIGTGPVILGIDPSRVKDRVGIIDRCGRRMGERIAIRMDPQGSGLYVAQQLASIIDRIKPDIVNIDVGSEATIYDLLVDWGHGHIINPINFGGSPIGRGPTGDKEYENRRAEMYDTFRLWFGGELPVQCPDDDGFHADVCAAIWGPAATRFQSANDRLVLEPKDAIKARLGYSPDLGDAGALTFAFPYATGMQSAQTRPPPRKGNRRTGY